MASTYAESALHVLADLVTRGLAPATALEDGRRLLDDPPALVALVESHVEAAHARVEARTTQRRPASPVPVRTRRTSPVATQSKPAAPTPTPPTQPAPPTTMTAERALAWVAAGQDAHDDPASVLGFLAVAPSDVTAAALVAHVIQEFEDAGQDPAPDAVLRCIGGAVRAIRQAETALIQAGAASPFAPTPAAHRAYTAVRAAREQVEATIVPQLPAIPWVGALLLHAFWL